MDLEAIGPAPGRQAAVAAPGRPRAGGSAVTAPQRLLAVRPGGLAEHAGGFGQVPDGAPEVAGLEGGHASRLLDSDGVQQLIDSLRVHDARLSALEITAREPGAAQLQGTLDALKDRVTVMGKVLRHVALALDGRGAGGAQAAEAGSETAASTEHGDDSLRAELQGLQEFQLALVQGRLPFALLAVDTDLQVFVWSPALEKLLSIPAAAAIGRRLDAIDIRPVELRDRMARTCRWRTSE